MQNIKRGSIYYIRNDPAEVKARCEQGGTRPAVVLSNDIGNMYAPIVTVAYLTTKNKKNLPTHVVTNATGRKSVVLCEQVATVSKERVLKCIGKLPENELKQVEQAVEISLGLKGGLSK